MIPKVGLIGISGFGATHGRVILNLSDRKDLECDAFADIKVDPNDPIYRGLVSNGAKYYKDYKDMLDNHRDLDFVVIATPIPLHNPMAVYVLNKGFNVLLEKPPAVTIQDLDAIIKAKQDSGKLCAVDFQNTSHKSFIQLNDILCEGKLG